MTGCYWLIYCTGSDGIVIVDVYCALHLHDKVLLRRTNERDDVERFLIIFTKCLYCCNIVNKYIV